MIGSTRTPVAVFAFNRADMLRQTLRALEQCEDFEGRDVVVFCDGARAGVPEDQQSTARVRELAEKWACQSRAVLELRADNQGLRKSIISGVGRMVERYGRVIVLEDDLVTSRWFLRFMDQALDKFEQMTNVWQISGWSPPARFGNSRSGFLRVPGCWGWATWKRSWDLYNDDAASLLQKVLSADQHRFNIDGSYDYLTSLRLNAAGSLDTWHVRWYASMFLQNALAVYPGDSLTRNIGFDARGTNCQPGRTSALFTRQKLAQRLPELPSDADSVAESHQLLNTLRELFLWQGKMWTVTPLRTRVWNRVRYLLGAR